MEAVNLVFVGSPLVDITAKCTADTLTKYSLKPDGCIRATEHHRDFLRSLFYDPDSYVSPGGSALNSARIAKWILRDNGEVSFVGCVGDDIYKEWLTNTLQKESIISLNETIPDESTGICACLLTEGGGRSMITSHAAAGEISTEHLNLDHIKSKLSEASYLFAVGYLLSHSPDVVHALVNLCSEQQMFCLSLSAEYVCKQYKEDLLRILPRIDFLFGNKTEILTLAEAVSGQQSLTVEESLRIVGQLQTLTTSRPRRFIVLTRGCEPVIVADGSGAFKYFDVPREVVVVDSVGCGDALAGAFLATFALTNSLDISMQEGIKMAHEMTQTKGCDPPSKKVVTPIVS